MDLLGEIIERDVDEAIAPQSAPATGFPELKRPEKVSSWKSRFKQRTKTPSSNPGPSKTEKYTSNENDATESEAARIHAENAALLDQMSPEERERERKELIDSLDPKLVQSLMKRIRERSEIEGSGGTWVGNLPPSVEEALNNGPVPTEPHMPSADEPPFDEESDVGAISEAYEDIDDSAPLDYQIAQKIDHMSNDELFADVHFARPAPANLDMNDPNFNEKLHQQYFPDLPREIEKLEWMAPLDNAPKPPLVIDDVSECRFDFRGNLVPPSREIKSTTHSALHHHSKDPQLAGYTIPEMAHLARSTFASQRSIAIKMLGRILYKMGKRHYNSQLIPEVDEETFRTEHNANPNEVVDKIYGMFWDLIKSEKVIELLKLGAEEKVTKNVSVRAHAIDALWLWKQGGGDPRIT